MQKYGLSPNTFYPWCEKFSDGCKAALTGGPGARIAKAIQENANAVAPKTCIVLWTAR